MLGSRELKPPASPQPAAALRSHPCVALSSARAIPIIAEIAVASDKLTIVLER